MMTTEPPGPGASPLDRLFRLSIVACLLATLALFLPGVHGHTVAPAIDLVLDTIAAVVCVTLTTLAWARFRERQVVAAVYHSSAFMALSAAYGIAVFISARQAADASGLAVPEGVQVLVFAVARFAAALLFVVGGMLTGRRTYGWNPVWILVAPTIVVLLVALVGHWAYPPPDPLRIVTLENGSGLPHIMPFGALIHITTSVLFFLGAYSSRRLWRSGYAIEDVWIAVGLVFAGFAELHWVMFPSAHPGQVSTADLLRLACSGCLIAGLASAFRASQRALRTANVELGQLRDAEVERAAMEERTRLARELHDGLAQDLWLAKLRAGELLAMDDLPADARRAAAGAAAAIDVGLGDARDAVAALRGTGHADSGFCNLVRRTVEDHGDRFGLRCEFTFEGGHQARIAPRTQAEVLRIVQEALTNVAKHAEATLVGVRLAVGDDRFILRIADNGHGFDSPSPSTGYGLTSMRERAALIGGRLRITSSPRDGTHLILTAPFEPSGAGERPPAEIAVDAR